uniref:Phytosulfokine n=1 Tax=Sorghum propinquum TaxID=132711 RepID=Q7PCA2_SORPR|nr:TPA_exp: putative phytosulfokine peptide precursor [Sorghum propinquum]
MGRGRSSSWPPAAPALLLLLVVCFSHGVAAARLLPPLQPATAVPPQVLHQAENVVMAAAADGLVLQEGEAVGNGDELSISEMMGAEEEGAAAVCEGENDECLERRLLGDAHLDYIYTQHKGKP